MARLPWMALAALLAFACALPADAVTNRAKQRKLTDTQMLFTKAMRWGEFDQAWGVVDPKVRQTGALAALEQSRYKQVEITAYSEIGNMAEPDDIVVRVVELRVVNRNTMAERTLRIRERWRWDQADGRWWLQDGLPDLWQEQ